jgi:hypothetical protein
MLLSRADKENRVIELHKESKSIREIAAEVHMGFSDISSIIHSHFEPENVKSTPSKFSAAVKLFKKGAKPSDVVIKLDLTADEAEKFYMDFWRLERMHPMYRIYQENKSAIPNLLRLDKLLKKNGVSPKMYGEVIDFIEKQIFREEDDQKSLPNVQVYAPIAPIYTPEELERSFHRRNNI